MQAGKRAEVRLKEDRARQAPDQHASDGAPHRTPTGQPGRADARPYRRGRELIQLLKTALLIITALLLLLVIVVALASLRGQGTLLVILDAVQQVAVILFGAAFLFAILLAIEAVFDIGDQTRESLEVQREALAEARLSGAMLSEVGEALADDEEEDAEEEEAEAGDEQADPGPTPGENPDPADSGG